MKISPTLKAHLEVKQRLYKNQPVYNLGLGENQLPAPLNLIKQISLSTQKSYSFPNGEEKLHKQLLNILSDEYYSPTHLLIGNGLKELIFTLIGSFNGKIILPIPAWVSYQQIIDACYESAETGREIRL